MQVIILYFDPLLLIYTLYEAICDSSSIIDSISHALLNQFREDSCRFIRLT